MALAAARSGTAMATWFRRPSIVFPIVRPSRLATLAPQDEGGLCQRLREDSMLQEVALHSTVARVAKAPTILILRCEPAGRASKDAPLARHKNRHQRLLAPD